MTRCTTTTYQLADVPKHTAAKHISSKVSFKITLWTDMFTFDTCLRFTHTYKHVNGQKINF